MDHHQNRNLAEDASMADRLDLALYRRSVFVTVVLTHPALICSNSLRLTLISIHWLARWVDYKVVGLGLISSNENHRPEVNLMKLLQV